MKNRRSIIIAFLLCACMIVGVGYAAISNVMDISGTADFSPDDSFDGNVIFTSAEVLTHVGVNTASINADNKDKATFSVHNIMSVGETATFKFTVTNSNTEVVWISFRQSANNDDANTYYAVKYCDDAEFNNDMNTTGIQVAANGGTVDIYVQVSLTHQPATDETVSATFAADFLVEDDATHATRVAG